MSGWPRIYYKLLNLPLSILVKSKSIPADPAPELGLDTSRPIMYVLPYNSKADLLTLRAQCLAHDLPDPLEPLEIDGTLLPRYVFIHGGPRVFTYYTPKEESIKLFHDYLDLHRSNPNLDVQMVPVSVMFGRAPGREKGEVNPPLRMLNGVQKFFAVLWLGRDSFVRFSPSVSLRRMADEHGTDKTIAQKLARVARMHFARQRLAAVGPRLPARQDLFNKLLASRAIAKAVETFDMVIVNAGSSAGTEDYTVHILRELGEVLIHGVAIKPGKPVILAIVNNKPVIGLPGYPVSAYINFENFVIPVLQLLTGETSCAVNQVEAVLSKRLVSSLKHREYVRVKVGKVEDKLVASPLARGAGAAMSLVRADGFCIIPQNCEGIEAGEPVQVALYRDLQEIDHTVVAIGSHDLILDVISDLMPTLFPQNFLSSTHLGSMGGLMALKRGEAHIAPTHLLDEETGVYNIAYLKKLFHRPMALIKGVNRVQGILVQKGNPLHIQGIPDLTRVQYINRQRGAGTRVLLDYLLKQEKISPDQIQGYQREAATHMAVAAAIQGGSADAGMGILSAANALGLDFIPVGNEEYDFALPVEYLELEQVQHFLSVLKSDAFRKKVQALGGYGLEQTGTILYVDEV